MSLATGSSHGAGLRPGPGRLGQTAVQQPEADAGRQDGGRASGKVGSQVGAGIGLTGPGAGWLGSASGTWQRAATVTEADTDSTAFNFTLTPGCMAWRLNTTKRGRRGASSCELASRLSVPKKDRSAGTGPKLQLKGGRLGLVHAFHDTGHA